MGDDLMAEKIEIHPFVRASSLRAAEQIAIESARGGEVVDREGEMEGRQAWLMPSPIKHCGGPWPPRGAPA